MYQQHSKNTVALMIRASYKILGTSGGAPTAQQEHSSTDDKGEWP